MSAAAAAVIVINAVTGLGVGLVLLFLHWRDRKGEVS